MNHFFGVLLHRFWYYLCISFNYHPFYLPKSHCQLSPRVCHAISLLSTCIALLHNFIWGFWRAWRLVLWGVDLCVLFICFNFILHFVLKTSLYWAMECSVFSVVIVLFLWPSCHIGFFGINEIHHIEWYRRWMRSHNDWEGEFLLFIVISKVLIVPLTSLLE